MRPGRDTALKLRLAGMSGEAARVLGPRAMRNCADAQVRNAIGAALGDPALTSAHRLDVVALAATFGGPEETGDDTRSVTLQFRATEDEAEAMRGLADAAGLTLSGYVRQRALA